MPIRNITLPPTHNQRAPEQWRIISEHVDFDGKTVLDLGCGYGDLLWRAHRDGAFITGIEQNEEAYVFLCRQGFDFGVPRGAWYPDIGFIVSANPDWSNDIAICFSVLPYLDNPTATLHWIRQHSQQALIECQLSGDGPGPDWLKCPQDMRRWLDSIGWQSVERIGETTVEERGTKRGIWLCQQ